MTISLLMKERKQEFKWLRLYTAAGFCSAFNKKSSFLQLSLVPIPDPSQSVFSPNSESGSVETPLLGKITLQDKTLWFPRWTRSVCGPSRRRGGRASADGRPPGRQRQPSSPTWPPQTSRRDAPPSLQSGSSCTRLCWIWCS